jgi:uncharacterized protein (TIGR02099 family)
MHAHLTPAQRRWRRLRRGLLGAFAFAVIGMALVLASAATALPWLVDHPDRVREFLSIRLGRAVDFIALRAEWVRSGPIFTLDGLSVGGPDNEPPFTIGQAELAIDFYAWARRGVSFSEFRLVGLEIDAERGADGRWRVARLGSASTTIDIDTVLDLTGVAVRDARVRIRDAANALDVGLARVDLRVSNEYGARRFGGVAWIDADLAPLRFVCAAAGSGQDCWLGGRGVDAERWLRKLPLAGVLPARGSVDADVWLSFDRRLERLRLEASASDLVLRGTATVPFSSGIAIEPRASMPFLRVAARFERDGEAWLADWLDWRTRDAIEPDTRIAVRQAALDAPIAVRSPRIDLAGAAPLLALSDALPAGLRRVLYENSPAGVLEAVGLDFVDGRASGSLRLERVRIAAGSRTPGIDSVSGTLSASDGVFVLEPDPDLALTVRAPHVFREALALTLHEGSVGFWHDAGGAHIEATGLRFSGQGFAARAHTRLDFDGNGRRPTIDLGLVVDHGEVAHARDFWPINVMRAQTIAWLDRALVSGIVEGGTAILHGDLDDWPFREPTGRFEARAQVRDAVLDYSPQWPAARITSVDLEFSAVGLAANSDGGSVMGNPVALAHARIESFKDPVLELHVEGEGSGGDLLGLLRASPVQRTADGYLDSIEVGGRAEVGFDLTLPLRPDLGESRLFGNVRLFDADLLDRQWNLSFAQATGGMRFSNRGFAADDLAVRVDGDPAALSIAIGEFASDPQYQIEASLRGGLTAASVLSGVAGIEDLLPRVPGRAEWGVELTVDREGVDGKAPRKRVSVASDLRGITLDLPAPLRKDADSVLPVRFAVDLPVADSLLELELGRLLRFSGRMPSATSPFAGSLAFGMTELGSLPASGLRVRGDMAALDLGGWASLGAGGEATGSLDADVSVTELAVLGRAFADARVRFESSAEATRLALDGPGLVGALTLDSAAGTGVTAEFETLHLPEAMPSAPTRNIDPAGLPPLHLWVKDLRLGTAQLGSARIETVPIAGGLRVEQLDTSSPVIEVRARGDWTLVEGSERSRFGVTFSAENLGRMLDALGFAGVVDGGQTIVQLDGSWQGSPAQFGLSRIDGTLVAKVGQGRILDVNPGAGRLLGLVSLQQIPRRLSLDFSDFFRSGMSFDSIEGQFELRTGDAFTTDLVVRGPSADIAVSGRTGLSARDYDQELQVTPKVGSVLPVVGALALGPVGAAAGLVAQGVLRNPLDSMTRARYRVTGSWEKPQIDLIARERGDRTPREAERNG